MIEAGLESVESEDEQNRVIVTLQQGAISFRSLSEVLGSETTLGELAALERKVLHD